MNEQEINVDLTISFEEFKLAAKEIRSNPGHKIMSYIFRLIPILLFLFLVYLGYSSSKESISISIIIMIIFFTINTLCSI